MSMIMMVPSGCDNHMMGGIKLKEGKRRNWALQLLPDWERSLQLPCQRDQARPAGVAFSCVPLRPTAVWKESEKRRKEGVREEAAKMEEVRWAGVMEEVVKKEPANNGRETKKQKWRFSILRSANARQHSTKCCWLPRNKVHTRTKKERKNRKLCIFQPLTLLFWDSPSYSAIQ